MCVCMWGTCIYAYVSSMMHVKSVRNLQPMELWSYKINVYMFTPWVGPLYKAQKSPRWFYMYARLGPPVSCSHVVSCTFTCSM